MKLIQKILVFGLLGSLAIYLKIFRSSFLDRFLGLILFSGILGCILFPTITQKLAEVVGVGRGVDLFFYISGIAVLFVLLLMYSRIYKLEQLVTKLIREQTISKTLDEINSPTPSKEYRDGR